MDALGQWCGRQLAKGGKDGGEAIELREHVHCRRRAIHANGDRLACIALERAVECRLKKLRYLVTPSISHLLA